MGRAILLAAIRLGHAGCTRPGDLPEFRTERPTLMHLVTNAATQGGGPALGAPALGSSGCETQQCLARIAGHAPLAGLCDHAWDPGDSALDTDRCQLAPALEAYAGAVFGPESVGTALAAYVERVGGTCSRAEHVTCVYEWDWCSFHALTAFSGLFYFALSNRMTIVIDPLSDSHPVVAVLSSGTKTEISRSAYEACARSGRPAE